MVQLRRGKKVFYLSGNRAFIRKWYSLYCFILSIVRRSTRRCSQKSVRGSFPRFSMPSARSRQDKWVWLLTFNYPQMRPALRLNNGFQSMAEHQWPFRPCANGSYANDSAMWLTCEHTRITPTVASNPNEKHVYYISTFSNKFIINCECYSQVDFLFVFIHNTTDDSYSTLPLSIRWWRIKDMWKTLFKGEYFQFILI